MIRIQSGKDVPPALTEQAEPGQPTRPGPEETPLARVERQIGHIKVTPAPWDINEWERLPESDKSFRLARKVDWCDIRPEDKRRLLEREVDFTRVSPADQQWHLGQVLHDDGNYEGRRNQRVLDQIEKVSQLPRWPAMSHRERAAALERHVQWDGFDADDRFDVIENVLHGKDRSGWLDGIRTLAEKTAREDAIWEEAARRGNGSPNSEPYIRREWISFAQEVIDDVEADGAISSASTTARS